MTVFFRSGSAGIGTYSRSKELYVCFRLQSESSIDFDWNENGQSTKITLAIGQSIS